VLLSLALLQISGDWSLIAVNQRSLWTPRWVRFRWSLMSESISISLRQLFWQVTKKIFKTYIQAYLACLRISVPKRRSYRYS
jgi:hypothetical protein